MDKITALREEFGRVHKEAGDLLTLKTNEDREYTADEKTSQATRYARLEAIKAAIDENAKFAKLAFENGEAATPKTPPGKTEYEGANTAGDRPTFAQHKDAVNRYLRTGQRDNFTIMAGAGGVTLPASGTPIVIKRQRNPFKAALQAYGLEILNIQGYGNAVIFDDTANTADVIAQNNTSENAKEPAIVNLTGDVLYDSGSVWFANTYLSQSGFDPFNYLKPMLDARIEAAETTAWTAAAIAAASVGVTTASTTGVTYAEMVAWKYSLPVAGQSDGVFLVSLGLMQAIETMVDTTGRPLYRQSLSDDAPDRLLGWPVFVVNDLAAPAANAKTGIVASASALVAREYGPRRFVRYENVPTRPDQVGIREFANGGFGILPALVKVLKQAAS